MSQKRLLTETEMLDHGAPAQSAVAGIPSYKLNLNKTWKLFFWSYLTNTKRDQVISMEINFAQFIKLLRTLGRLGVAAKASARLTAVVDLPTPPLPLATTTTLPTPSITFRLGKPLFINASCRFFSCSSFHPSLVLPTCNCRSERPRRHCR